MLNIHILIRHFALPNEICFVENSWSISYSKYQHAKTLSNSEKETVFGVSENTVLYNNHPANNQNNYNPNRTPHFNINNN